jgi:hypothetical protein
MILENGTFVIGILSQLVTEPWASNGKSGTNYRLAISSPYEDRFGNPQTEVTTIDVASDEHARVWGECKELVGKRIAVPCRHTARQGGKTGAWVARFMPKNTSVTVVE